MKQNSIEPCVGCAGCGGTCGGCAACGGGEVLLCLAEATVLTALGERAFLPLYQKSQGGEPVFFPVGEDTLLFGADFSLVLESLARKKLLHIDPCLPLTGLDYGDVPAGTLCGSIALTVQGQEVLDALPPLNSWEA